MAQRTCTLDECDRKHYARGFCHMHYKRWERWGDPLKVAQIQGNPVGRFWSKVDKHGPLPTWAPFLGPCWLWTDALDRDGYGRVKIDYHNVMPHRFAYEMLVEFIPAGLTIDHVCRVRHCVNPAHMDPVTNAENVRRARFCERRAA